MEIKNSEWKEFAEFIAAQSEHMISEYWEDGTYICCPFSTIERAYEAFGLSKKPGATFEDIRKLYDINYVEANPRLEEEKDLQRYYEELDAEEARWDDYIDSLSQEVYGE